MDENSQVGDDNLQEDSLTLLVYDNYSGAEAEETLIIRDAKSLKKFFVKINRTRKPGLPVPEVDFSKDMVIIHCSPENSGSKSNTLYLKEESDDAMIIGVKRAEMNSSSSAVTSPFSVYKLPLSDKKIVVQ